jgi:hypothetical protein
MNSIIFSGCSLTWGEGLWRESPDCKNDQKGLKYQYDNRWSTKVANHFNRTPVVKAQNSGNNLSSIKFVKKEIDVKTDMVIFQTTQFIRAFVNSEFTKLEDSINYQIEELEKLVEEVEKLGTPVRFIHWMWPDISSYELTLLPENTVHKICSDIIRNRTIYILDRFNFNNMIDKSTFKKVGSDSNKYTLAAKFNCDDFHMNQEGHDVLANEIINYIEKNKLL